MYPRSTTSGRIQRRRADAAGLADVLSFLRSTRPEVVRSWFHRLQMTYLEHGVVKVWASDAAKLRYLETHCKPAFTEAVQALTGRLVAVTFAGPEAAGAGGSESAETASTNLWGPLDPAFRLDRFLVGPCNKLAHAAAVAVAQQPSEAYNPLFVYGPSGVGKTHLLQGIVHAAADHYGDDRCCYVPSRTFVHDAIQALEDEASSEFRARCGTLRLLAIDDVHLLSGRDRSQEELFLVLNLLLNSRGQIVMAADREASEIPAFEDRLASRLAAGLAIALDVPCLETRMAIARSKAGLLAMDLPEEVVRWVAERYDRNVRDLTDALVRIDALSEFESSPITIELVERALEPACPITPQG